MSDPQTDPTLPPHQPNTFRTWLPRIWRGATAQVAAHPDVALVVFLLAFGLAVVL